MSDFRIKYIIDCGSIYKRIKNAVFDFCGVQGYKESYGNMSRNFEFSFYKKDSNQILIFQKEQQRSNKQNYYDARKLITSIRQGLILSFIKRNTVADLNLSALQRYFKMPRQSNEFFAVKKLFITNDIQVPWETFRNRPKKVPEELLRLIRLALKSEKEVHQKLSNLGSYSTPMEEFKILPRYHQEISKKMMKLSGYNKRLNKCEPTQSQIN
ncbi:hypothetical protein pb186bvf_011851 [Paramecium bursaria]